jgi:glutamate transport system substrate-binding protein
MSAALVLGAAACGTDRSGSGGGKAPANPVNRARTATFAAGSTMEKLSGSQKIRIGTKFDQPGFGLKGADGTLAGFDVEIAKFVVAALAIPSERIEWMETPSAIREQVLEQNRVDLVVATYTINDKRKQIVDFAGPYYVAGQDLMVRGDDNSIAGPEAFKDGKKKVCSVINSTAATGIKKYLGKEAQQLTLVDVYQKCVDALKTKQVDAVTSDNVVLLGFIAKNTGLFKLVGKKFSSEPYGIGLHKGDAKFRDFVNDVLEKSFQDGRYEKAWMETAGRFAGEAPAPPTIDRN